MPGFRGFVAILLFGSLVSVMHAQDDKPTALPLPPAGGLTAGARVAPSYESDPKFIAAMTEAKRLERARQYGFARDTYAKANKIAGNECVKCLDQMAQIDEGLHNWKDAIAEAQRLVAMAATPREKSLGEARLGQILLEQGGDKPKPAQLEAAHTQFQAAITDFPKNMAARWSDGCVLARLGKNDEAKQEFSVCAQGSPESDPMHARAVHFAENPELSLLKRAPAFDVKTADGTHFNLDNMTGRVVLIDFWATWCGPCNEELPHLQKIAKEFANEPLVIISISDDSNEATWREFIAKHNMTWVQFRDADHSIQNKFGVTSIPHYFTIDSDGVLTAEMMGSDSNVEGKLKKLVKRAAEAQAAAAAPVSATN
jgi:thiol-disulfide isomerase/thioredoxin